MTNISTIEQSGSSSAAGGPQPAKLSQLEQLLRQGRTFLQDLRAKLEQVTVERDQLATALKERDASHEKLWAEQADMQRAESERHQREVADLKRELAAASAARDAAAERRNDLESQLKGLQGVRSQLDEAVAAHKRLAEQLREGETQRVSLEKALGTAVDEVEQLRTDADRAAALAREIFEIHHK